VIGALKGPHIDYAALSPLIALLGGATIVLLAGLLSSRFVRQAVVPALAIVAFGTALGLGIWQWDIDKEIISGALRIDDLSIAMTWVFCLAGIATVLLSWRSVAPREAAHGEYYALLLTAAAGMVVLAGATNTITLFLGYELLSIPLYVLCATEMRRAGSLESGRPPCSTASR
jgi:NADH-quinone oxidoreductase subunit N